jgi:hypothetical protein
MTAFDVTIVVRFAAELSDDDASDREADAITEAIEDAVSGIPRVYDESVSVIDWTSAVAA